MIKFKHIGDDFAAAFLEWANRHYHRIDGGWVKRFPIPREEHTEYLTSEQVCEAYRYYLFNSTKQNHS